MIRALAFAAVVSLAFGAGSYRLLGQPGAFQVANGIVGAACALAAAGLALRRSGRGQPRRLRGPALRSIARALFVCALAAGAYALAAASDVRLDWTFEGRFELAPATRELLARLPGPLRMTLYHEVGDPRVRGTRLLLEEMARGLDVEVREQILGEHPREEDHYGLAASNSVVLEIADDWRLVERPREGTLYEGLAQLANPRDRVVYASIGAGEGNLGRSDESGYSGLRAALETEGYELRPLPLALADEIPPDASLLLVVAPQRPIPPSNLAALRRWLDAGGRLVALLEPESSSGLEDLLAGYGLASEGPALFDPTAGAFEGEPPGFAIVASRYSDHPLTRGLDANRMTFFRRTRAFTLHKPELNDRLAAVVYASRDSRLDHPDARPDYHAIVATSEFRRGGPTARIVAFGDSDFASNRYLRALYNLDLMLNAVHWAAQREPAITIRPKSGGRQLVQFPVPLERSLQALYGAGLVIPELLLLAGGLVWLRQRGA